MSELQLSGVRDVATGEASPLHLHDGVVVAGPLGPAARLLDGHGLWLAPGFIDLQLNGAFGHDFSAEPASAWQVGVDLAATGVTAFLPTVVSSAPDRYEEILDAWAGHPAAPGAQPLGWHLEGPMLSPTRAGAHDPAVLRSPDTTDTRRWRADAGVRLVTLAPELPGALERIAELCAAGVVVAAGHTDADVSAVPRAVDAGVRYATHLLNAMRGFDARAPGIAAGLLLDRRVAVGIIVDGYHLAPDTIELVWRLAGPGRLSVVTDGIAALGRLPGAYRIGGVDVTVGTDGSARLGDGRLAGAVTPLPAALANLRAATGCGRAEAIACVTAVPAAVLGLRDRGHLRPGARGDAVLLDDELRVMATLVGGEVVHADGALAWD